jgi:hypothetical protein
MSSPIVPPIPGQPPGFVSVGDVAQQEIDPKNFGTLFAQGQANSGWIERLAIALYLAFTKVIEAMLSLLASKADSILAALGAFFLAAQGNNTPGFYNLTADLITDLTGVEVDGGALFDKYQKRGRIAAMQATGAAFVDLLASEFAGVTQTAAGGVFQVAPGTGQGGLPSVQLSEQQGMNAARAFLGFAMSFAVREGNTDFFASLIPFGIGEGYKAFAEDLSKSLGLGRLTRLALKPLFQNLVSIPMTWAFNKQYTPTLLGPGEAIRANIAGLLSQPDSLQELQRHGYSQPKIDAFSVLHAKWPSPKEHFLAELVGQQDTATTDTFLSYLGFTPRAVQTLRTADQNDFSRRIAFELAHRIVPLVTTGAIDLNGYSAVLETLTLSAQEKKGLLDFVTELHSLPRKRLTFAQMTTAFVDGIVAVDQVAEFLQEEGYRQDDIAILLQIDLFKLKVSKDKAAAAAAKAAAKKTKSTASSTPPAGG